MWPHFVIVAYDYELIWFIVKCCMLTLFISSIALISNFLFNIYIFDRIALTVTVFSVSFYVIHHEFISLSLWKFIAARLFARLSCSFISSYFVISLSSLGSFNAKFYNSILLGRVPFCFWFAGGGIAGDGIGAYELWAATLTLDILSASMHFINRQGMHLRWT